MNQLSHEQMTQSRIRVPVAVSPSHVHLTPAVIEQLFCDHYRLHERSRLGATQFAAQESVTLIGPHGQLTDIRVVGPPRRMNQVELLLTDALKLGIDVPERTPGDLDGTPGIIIKGPRMEVALKLGVIRALPHLHMTPRDADRFGLADRGLVNVIGKPFSRRIVLRDVHVQVSADHQLELHLDADAGKAAGLASGDYVSLRTPGGSVAESSRELRGRYLA
jgi:propanediol utilization protein